MKVSELIKKLEEVQQQDGDMEIYVTSKKLPISEFIFCDTDDDIHESHIVLAEKTDKEMHGSAYWFIDEYEYLTCSRCGFNYYTGYASMNEAKENYNKPFGLYYCPHCGSGMSRDDGSFIDASKDDSI